MIVNSGCSPDCVYYTGGGGGVLETVRCTDRSVMMVPTPGVCSDKIVRLSLSSRLEQTSYISTLDNTPSPLTRDVDSDMTISPHTMAYHPPPPLLPRPEMTPGHLHPLHHHPPPPPPFQHHQHFPPHFPALGPTNSFSTPSGGEYCNISKLFVFFNL